MSTDDAIPLPDDVRRLMTAANYVHLSTLRADGTPRNWIVWVGVEGDHLLVCTGDGALKARDMHRHPAVGLSVASMDDPYDMAAVQGRVVDVRDDSEGHVMDAISVKYTGQPFPTRGAGRVCFVIAAVKAGSARLGFEHRPAAEPDPSEST